VTGVKFSVWLDSVPEANQGNPKNFQLVSLLTVYFS